MWLDIVMSVPSNKRFQGPPKWYTRFHSAEMVWLRGEVVAARNILMQGRGGSKGSFTYAECCTLAEVRVMNALGEQLKEFQGLKALNCMSSIEDFVGLSLVCPINRAARVYKEAKNTSAWQLAVLKSSKREYCLMNNLSFA